ncbi:MAG: restriction endonuclease subunit S [Polyangiaceae bacterium]
MSFPRYPEYKNSGTECLGDLPTHWDVLPLKFLSSLKGRLGWQGLRADEYTDEGPFLVTSEHFENDKVAWDRCYHVSEERFALAPEIQLRPHDLLIMKDGAAMGKLAYIDDLPGPACLNSHLLLFRPVHGRHTNRFLYYQLCGPAFETYMLRERRGSTFFGISQESIGNFPFAVPPLSEQLAITRFLDQEIAKIESLIAEQKRLIALSREKRQAVISRAVTKGLNAGVLMKESGIDWLGKVPAHWAIKKLKHLSPQLTVGIVIEPSKLYADDGVPALRSLNIKQGVIEPAEMVCISQQGHKQHSKSRLNAGDLVVVRSGRPGTTAVIPGELDGCNCIDLIIIRRPTVGSEWFLCWYLASEAASHQFSLGSGGAIQQHFNVSAASELIVTVPPPDEQLGIVAHVGRETRQLDTLVATAEHAIELLQERRTALISAAVTGQIDVRSTASDDFGRDILDPERPSRPVRKRSAPEKST